MDPETVFPTLKFFGLLRMPLMYLPNVIINYAFYKISLNRIYELLMSSEIQVNLAYNEESEYSLEINNGSFSWKPNEHQSDLNNLKNKNDNYEPYLTDINIKIKKGDLVGIVGKVGSGKSSLLKAIIGEMSCLNGKIITNGSFSFASQSSWIQNTTIEKNITFGLEYDKKRYSKVISNCLLLKDFDNLPDGDQTEIGERGVNISGGQKQRINLARCIYYNKDIILMDDPLSAVDSRISEDIFQNCILKELKNTTRIMVTHQLQFLSRVDYVIFMKEGRIIEQGPFDLLIQNKSEFYMFLNGYGDIKKTDKVFTSNNDEPEILKKSKAIP